MSNLYDVFSIAFVVLLLIGVYVLPESQAKNVAMTLLMVLSYVFALAGCTDPKDAPGYPTNYRLPNVPGADVIEVCYAIQEVACDEGDDKCKYSFLNRCVVEDARIEAGSVEAWDALWIDCLSAVSQLSGYRGTVQPVDPACATLTPYWHE